MVYIAPRVRGVVCVLCALMRCVCVFVYVCASSAEAGSHESAMPTVLSASLE